MLNSFPLVAYTQLPLPEDIAGIKHDHGAVFATCRLATLLCRLVRTTSLLQSEELVTLPG
jgi:hypothetical protein